MKIFLFFLLLYNMHFFAADQQIFEVEHRVDGLAQRLEQRLGIIEQENGHMMENLPPMQQPPYVDKEIILQEARERLEAITDFGKTASKEAMDRYFYRLVDQKNRNNEIRKYYVLYSPLQRAAGNLIIKLMERCEIPFTLSMHNYKTVWASEDNEHYRDYVYKGFETVDEEFYWAIYSIFMFPHCSDKISTLITDLRNKMNLSLEQRELAQKTYLLFLTDYLIAAKFGDQEDRKWLKENYLLPEQFLIGHNEKKVITQAMIIALFGKAFKSCLRSSNTALEIFSNILDNLKEMYEVVFVNLHEYITKQDQEEYDHLSDGGVHVLQELLEQRNCINTDYFYLLKETLKTMRQQAQEMREFRHQQVLKQQEVRGVLQLEIPQPQQVVDEPLQQVPQQQVVEEEVEDPVAPQVPQPQPSNIQKKAQRLLLLLLFGGGTMAGIYYLAKHYNSLKNWFN